MEKSERFQVGDVVRVVVEGQLLVRGAEHTVRGLHDGYDGIYRILIGHSHDADDGFAAERFELVRRASTPAQTGEGKGE